MKNTYFSLCKKNKHITDESREENESECIDQKLIKKDITAVYYLDYKDSKMSTEKLLKIPSKAVLLWEK